MKKECWSYELRVTSFELRGLKPSSNQITLDMRNFKQLKIWQKGFDIATNSFKLTSTFPKEEKYGLTSQITKSAVSIPSNVAEGSSRSSNKDYSRFIEISLGASFELETQVLIADAVNFGQKEIRDTILRDLDEEQKMLMSFMNRLNS
jgi:four helix bundle protein